MPRKHRTKRRSPTFPDVVVPQPGRPSKYNKRYHCHHGKRYAMLGATNAQLGEFFGVVERTVEIWISDHQEFGEAVRGGREYADANVARGLYKRAIGYKHPAEKIMQFEGNVIRAKYTEHYPPDTAAAKFWLTNRRPDGWRERSSTEWTGKNGGPIQVVIGAGDDRL